MLQGLLSDHEPEEIRKTRKKLASKEVELKAEQARTRQLETFMEVKELQDMMKSDGLNFYEYSDSLSHQMQDKVKRGEMVTVTLVVQPRSATVRFLRVEGREGFLPVVPHGIQVFGEVTLEVRTCST